MDDEDWVMLYELVDDETFKEVCLKLKQNDPDEVVFDANEVITDYVDDTKLALLERSLDGNTHVYQMAINLTVSQRGPPFTRDGLEAFAVGVSHSSIIYLDLTFELSKPLQQALFMGLRKSHSLKSLTLTNILLSIKSLSYLFLPAANELAASSRRGCGETRIEALRIARCTISAALSEMKHFARSFQNGVSVRRLHMNSNRMSDDMLIAFTKHWRLDSSIAEFTLFENDISFSAVHCFMERTCVFGALKTLRLINWPVDYVGLKAIGGMLGRMQLEHLSLGSCINAEGVALVLDDSSRLPNIRNEAFRDMATGLRQNVTLQKFSLTRGLVNADEAVLLLQATINHPTLKHIDLSDNVEIGFRGVQMIGEMLPNLTLEALNLFDLNTWGDMDASPTAKQRAGSALVKGIIENTHLSWFADLVLYSEDAWQFQIRFYTRLNEFGRNLLLRGQPPASIWPLVFEKLKDAGSIFYYLREQPGLVTLPIPAAKKRKMEA